MEYRLKWFMCDAVRLSKQLVGHRSIWRTPKYLRLCSTDNYLSRFIVEEATTHSWELLSLSTVEDGPGKP